MPLAALLALLLTPLPALECIAPPTPLCQLLIPNLVIFIGKPIARAPLPKGGILVTFEVQELFWGPTGQRTLKLGFGQYGNPSAEPEFFAVLPRADGHYYYLPGFCHNLHFPVSHPFVTDYRRLAAERAPVRLRIRATSNRAPVADTAFQLSGNGLPFHGAMNGDAPYRIPALRPGIYKLSAKRPNFTQAQPNQELSIPPATCAEVDIRMTSASQVRGVARDARGNPLRNATLHLKGTGTSLANGTAPPPPSYHLSQDTRTDDRGQFTFLNVFPGWYYLAANAERPVQTFYPGVSHWTKATQIVVREGNSIHDIVFTLPDLTPPR